jgi:hypothetical protein
VHRRDPFVDDPEHRAGAQKALANDSASVCCARTACAAIATQDSWNVLCFSATMRWNSRWSRADGVAPARARRVMRWATTCGTASARSADLLLIDRALRGREMGIGFPRDQVGAGAAAYAVSASQNTRSFCTSLPTAKSIVPVQLNPALR